MRNKFVAALLAFFFGYFGAHKFYLGSISVGIIYLFLSWTFIPSILAVFDFVKLILTPNQTFEATYNTKLIAPANSGTVVSDTVQGKKSLINLAYNYLESLYLKRRRYNIRHQDRYYDKLGMLGELKKLYDGEIITAEEFEAERRNILSLIYPEKSFPSNSFGEIKSYSLAPAQTISNLNSKLDINNCSKDELVRVLELPIVYANDIESLKNEGYIFTHIEELSDIAGLPKSYLGKLADQVFFAYNANQELEFSWQRLNVMSIEGLIASGLNSDLAQQIVAEREKNGEYRSVIDIKRRTSIPFHNYKTFVQKFPAS